MAMDETQPNEKSKLGRSEGVDTSPPPSAFERPPWPKTLTIFSKEPGVIYLYDHKGFLCTCSESDLGPILRAQSAPHDAGQPHYHQCARNLLYPGYSERLEAEALAMRNMPPAVAPAKRAPAAPTKALTLSDLGL